MLLAWQRPLYVPWIFQVFGSLGICPHAYLADPMLALDFDRMSQFLLSCSAALDARRVLAALAQVLRVLVYWILQCLFWSSVAFGAHGALTGVAMPNGVWPALLLMEGEVVSWQRFLAGVARVASLLFCVMAQPLGLAF